MDYQKQIIIREDKFVTDGIFQNALELLPLQTTLRNNLFLQDYVFTLFAEHSSNSKGAPINTVAALTKFAPLSDRTDLDYPRRIMNFRKIYKL